MVKVSIIVPVYNVVDYIDECMISIVNQTFRDFEVILINDGSTDGSDEKCEQWARKDKRIKYITKRNEGLSPTRNLGIQKSKGEYISFIDSDDWIDLEFLEKLIYKASETSSKIVECDIYRVNNTTGKKIYKISSGSIGMRESLEDHMIYGYTSLCKCLIHRSLFEQYSIKFPECHSPARGIYAVLLALSGKVENVNEALYYYRIYRPGSLTEKPRESIENTEVGIKAFNYLINEFKRCGIYVLYKDTIERIIKYKMSDLLTVYYQRNSIENYIKMKNEYKNYLIKWFPDSIEHDYVVLGGYNLNRITWNMNFLHDPNNRFNFSSIISVMNPIDSNVIFEHSNIYRKIMINRDVYSLFWSMMRENNPDFIIVDFMEERFDILEGSSGYITKSDAWDDMEIDDDFFEIIPRKSDKCTKLWKKSCDEFILKMQLEYPDTKIILVKNYLSVKYGNIYNQYNYQNKKDIEEINKILEMYYEYFEQKCKNVKIINTQNQKNYFTDEKYTYGIMPSHLNDIINREIALKIEANIRSY